MARKERLSEAEYEARAALLGGSYKSAGHYIRLRPADGHKFGPALDPDTMEVMTEPEVFRRFVKAGSVKK